MGFGVGGGSRMLDLRMVQSHKRSKSASFPEKKRAEGDQPSSNTSFEASQRIKLDMGRSNESAKDKPNQYHSITETSLKQEIDQLETRLQDQFKVRCAFEKALGYPTASSYMLSESNDIPMPKQAIDLIKDIAVLEMEVIHLEQYLLSLYRKAFDQQISSASPNSEKEKPKPPPVTTPRRRLGFSEEHDPLLDDDDQNRPKETEMESSFHRSHSQRSSFESRKASLEDSWSKATTRSCHSQPLYAQKGENLISLAEHLGTRISDHVPETPNKLSEGMVKCMSEIYCKLAEPAPSVLLHEGLSSPNSSLSSRSAFSPSDQYDTSSPGLGNNSSSFDVRLDNSFHAQGEKEDFSGPYSNMVEVLCIYRDAKKANEVEDLLQNFKSLISRLEEVDPSKLKHEEKLAFWINVHNALVMHAYLAYGIPQNNVKRVLLLLKAAYNVGGHTVSAEAIQSSILGCKMSHPGQWIRLLFASKKFKAGDERLAFAIDHPEPLLHFALASGSHSDPPVRVYTPKKIQQELETSKEDYIRMNLSLRNQKVQLPKLVETFAKESGLCSAGLREMVNRSIPESSRKCFKRCQSGSGKSRKAIDWIPHSFTFRYLIFREAAK
ncbi:uncharacterized protein LOC103829585 [Brassica rapa]|uniref:DUF547 domain-containing protein n=1 Tax=Brassica campestris TaxID=3711 RepID=M4D6H6_BRACM|nr:uncharacterized protein LOC103829585 [Brassica rapa]XP_009103508.1 uncharacterized protein LOC103829585 [Brassica rapa]XP_033131232.1 uncharacterized protein LOC103829585 [Brassica rapa]